MSVDRPDFVARRLVNLMQVNAAKYKYTRA